MSFYSVVNTLPNEANYNYKNASLNHNDLMRKLPLSSEPSEFELDMNRSIWIHSGMIVPDNNREYSATVNEYLVPVDTNIVLYVKKSLFDSSCPDYLVFDMSEESFTWAGAESCSAFEQKLYDAVCVIRFLEDRRNAWLEDRIEKGLELPQDYDCWCKDFDIRSNRSMACVLKTKEARPNHIVSDSLVGNYHHTTADYYMEHWKEFTGAEQVYWSREDHNIDIVNWINRNRYDLANLGFYASNFPDVIFFANNPAWYERNNNDLPVGKKVYKKVDNRTASEKTRNAAEQAKTKAKVSTERTASGFVNSPLLKAAIKMLPVLIVMLLLRLLEGHFYLFNRVFIMQLFIYLCGSNFVVAMIYILCVLVYYGRQRS